MGTCRIGEIWDCLELQVYVFRQQATVYCGSRPAGLPFVKVWHQPGTLGQARLARLLA